MMQILSKISVSGFESHLIYLLKLKYHAFLHVSSKI